MNRREFIFAGGAFAAAVTSNAAEPKSAVDAKAADKPLKPLLSSAPVLQNAAETSIGVAFAVSADASGYVDYSTDPGLKGAKRAYSGARGLMDVKDTFATIRITGLKPATKYYYRIGADRISFKGGYNMKNLGPELDEKIHSFTTLGRENRNAFCVINDTHGVAAAMDLEFKKIRQINPAVVVWNGDTCNTLETLEEAMKIFIHAHKDHPEWAADIPYMFVPGNHDYRGRFNRNLGDLMMYREPTERSGRFWELGRNFVQRLGDIALIGLDTGEDKLDTNPNFAGIFRMKEYRELQARWLAEAIESDDVKSAKFKVAFCHLPLFDADPTQNPGDIAPDDTSPLYKNNFASWQRTCANLWGPSFVKTGVNLVITAHMHRFRIDEPSADRPWTQIVGGGTTPGSKTSFPTVIEGRVENGALRVLVHNVGTGEVVLERSFR